MSKHVFISWLAKYEDPYWRDPATLKYILDGTNRRPGPIYGALIDAASPYKQKFDDAFILMGSPSGRVDRDQSDRFRELQAMVLEHRGDLTLKPHQCNVENPADHKAVFNICLGFVSEIRRKYPQAELVINISSGTPAMHTAWVLLSEMKQIDGPHTLVRGVPPPFRTSEEPSSVHPVAIGIDSGYGKFKSIQSKRPSTSLAGTLNFEKAKSPILRSFYSDLKLFAPVNVPLLILGERGTGKTVASDFVRAAYLDANDRKVKSASLSLNCGQFGGNEEALKSEIFGHTAEAYTGATKPRDGILKSVNGDTLFLDEIGDLGPAIQRLLIRVIEEKRYAPWGSEKYQNVDFRLVTATNKSLEQLNGGLLDRDFFDRIAVYRVEVPPLRNIPEDLDWIWDDMLSTTASRMGIDEIDLTDRERETLISRLRNEYLPGNRRDLIRLASHLLLFLQAKEGFTTRSAAIDGALKLCFDDQLHGDDARELARRFADNASSRDLLLNPGFHLPKALDAYRRYLGLEIGQHLPGRKAPKTIGTSYESARQWREKPEYDS
jgi:sigma54-dependent transcription regulator